MKKSLVIVESPTKAKMMKRFLDPSFKVLSSKGHIIDLPKSKLGIDIEAGFVPQYKVIKGREKIAKEIKKEAKGAERIYLATDPDREGEAISWHIKNLIKDKKLKDKEFLRVVFHEITKDAILKAFDHPATLDINKVNAQQARRILDRVVGYLLSPFLWKRICRGLSAGRVQSVALKFIVEREKEIKAFIPQKYYTIDAYFEKDGKRFKARFAREKGEKITVETREKAEQIKEAILGKEVLIKKVSSKISLRKPYPPFTTSTLQQEAYRKLRYSTSRTMLIAQKLYEGLELKEEEMTGLITYMRTDSHHIAPVAKKDAREFVGEFFGQDYLAEKEYKFKSKGIIQAAHEAIRPTKPARRPEDIEASISGDELKLYALIWKRFIACFMKEARLENTQVILSLQDYEFLGSGQRLVFDGFLKIYPEKINEDILPVLEQSSMIKCVEVVVEEKTTNPPPRFNDASMVKLLEEKGIGRPSTYAPTIYTLISRDYVRREKGSFAPTDLGMEVMKLLSKFFTRVLDDNFTAKMEEALDDVEKGDAAWDKILQDFYPSFKKNIEDAEQNSEKQLAPAGRICEQCGKEMVFRYSRKGRFISCSDYPTCKNAHSITTGIACPECKEGELLERKNRKGQRFYGCTKFPQCRYTVSKLPDEEKEPENPEDEEGSA